MNEHIDDLCSTIELEHHCRAEHVDSTLVIESFDNQRPRWTGVVETFELVGCAEAQKCYGWCQPQGSQIRYITILAKPPVVSPKSAVHAAFTQGKRPLAH